MDKKPGDAASVSDVEEPPSGAEFILGSANWNERLANARVEREKALSKRIIQAKSQSSLNASEDNSSLDQTTSESAVGDPTSNQAPSIEDILTTANWNDRIAKATARREQIIGERRPNNSSKALPAPEGLTQPYKDVVRGAFSGLATSLKSQNEGTVTPAAPVIDEDEVVAEDKKRRFGLVHYSAIVGVILIAGVVLPGPFRNLATNAINGAVVAFIGPEISSAPRLGHQAEITTSLALTVELPAQVFDGISAFGSLENDQFASQTSPSLPSPLGIENKPVFPTDLNISFSTNDFRVSPKVSLSVSDIGNRQDTFPADAQMSNSLEFSAVTKPSNLSGFPAVNSADTIPAQIPRLIENAPDTMSISPLITNVLAPEAPPVLAFGIAAPITAWKPQTIAAISLNPAIYDLPASIPEPLSAFVTPLEIVGLSNTVRPEVTEVLLPEKFETGNKMTALNLTPKPPITDLPLAIQDPVAPPEDTSVILALSGNYSIHLRAPSSLAEDKLNAFASALSDTGFSVNPPKRVGFTVSNNHVRYYHSSDAEAAEMLAAAVDGAARDFTDYRPSPPVGTIEVWLAGKSSSRSAPRSTSRSATQDPAITNLQNRLLQSLRRGDHL